LDGVEIGTRMDGMDKIDDEGVEVKSGTAFSMPHSLVS
jgi:hypothetical protein